MSRLAILTSVIALAAVSANCANDPGQANSIGSIVPSSVMATSSDATLSPLAKGGKPALSVSDSTINMVPIESTDGSVYFGQHVTFDVVTTATEHPWVTNRCYQNSSLVLEMSQRMDLGTLYSRTFVLGPTPLWQSGGAECEATLEDRDDYYTRQNGKIIALAVAPYSVQP